MKIKTDHIRVENTPAGDYRMFCTHCGRWTDAKPPCSMEMFLVMSRQFIKEHRHCPPPAEVELDELKAK